MKPIILHRYGMNPLSPSSEVHTNPNQVESWERIDDNESKVVFTSGIDLCVSETISQIDDLFTESYE